MTGAGQAPPRLVFLTTAAERQMRRWIARRGADRGISAAAAGVLLQLEGRPGATVGDVTSALQGSAAGVSGLLARMDRAGLVRRHVDAADRRTVHLQLTPEGVAAVEVVREALDQLNARLTEGFTADELATVARWLEHTERKLR